MPQLKICWFDIGIDVITVESILEFPYCLKVRLHAGGPTRVIPLYQIRYYEIHEEK